MPSLARDKTVSWLSLLAYRDEQLEPFWRLHLLALEMTVDAFDRLGQLPLRVRLGKAAHRDFGSAGIGVAGCKQRRNPFLLRGPGEVNAGLLLAQPYVAQ